MPGQSGDGEQAEAPAHAEDRINWARRRTHARQRAADSRQRRIDYSLEPLPAAGPAHVESAAPYAGNGDRAEGGNLPPPNPGPAPDPRRTPPSAPGADGPPPALDPGC
jgi:hypothetical protein